MPGRVLIIEDTQTKRMILRARLRAAYYDVTEVDTGEKGLEMAMSNPFDLVLLDIMLPGIDGFEVCRRLKDCAETAHIPVVMLTALDDQSDRVAGIEAGADDFLTKPVDNFTLLSRVSSLIRTKMLFDELMLRSDTAGALAPDVVMNPHIAVPFDQTLVLVVAGDQDFAHGIANRLRFELGCRAQIVPGAAAAQKHIEHTPFDAILIHHELADGDALRLGSIIRARPETRLSAVMLFTPSNDLRMASTALDIGFSDYVPAPHDPVELTARLRAQLRRKAYSDKLREKVRTSMRDAITDPLTGCYNRRYAFTHLDAMIERCQASGSQLAVMMLDIDCFKIVNDNYGHNAGDKVLKEFARRLHANVRGLDLVARMGGEEFLVVLPDVQEHLADEIAERIRECIAGDEFAVTDNTGMPAKLKITVSIGLAQLETGETGDMVISRADKALYMSKDKGRNRVTASAVWAEPGYRPTP